jgi:hypothetical protein
MEDEAEAHVASFDAQIAAIAHPTGTAVATRMTKDLGQCGISVVDPRNG